MDDKIYFPVGSMNNGLYFANTRSLNIPIKTIRDFEATGEALFLRD